MGTFLLCLRPLGSGSCRCATPCVLAAPDYRRRRLRAHGGPRLRVTRCRMTGAWGGFRQGRTFLFLVSSVELIRQQPPL